VFAVLYDSARRAFADPERDCFGDVESAVKDKLEIFLFFIEYVNRYAIDVQGFLDDVEYLPQHLPQIKQGPDSSRDVVMDIYFAQLLFEQVAQRLFAGMCILQGPLEPDGSFRKIFT
jgi:hypothetical protein